MKRDIEMLRQLAEEAPESKSLQEMADEGFIQLYTERDIVKDRAMCEQATPGPWIVERCPEDFRIFAWFVRVPAIEQDKPLYTAAVINGEPQDKYDVEFIAEARTALPYWIERTAHLEKDLALNVSMLAKQCDMAREAETKQMEAERKLQEAESDFQEVLIAVWRQFSVRSGHGRRTVYSAGGLYALDLVEAFLRKRKLLGSRGQVCDP